MKINFNPGIVLLLLLPACFNIGTTTIDMDTIFFNNLSDVRSLITISQAQITPTATKAITELEHSIKTLIERPENAYTFASTFGALDTALGRFARPIEIFQALSLVEPNEAKRNALSEAVVTLKNALTDTIETNQALYKVLKKYATDYAEREHLSPEQSYAIKEILENFEREGLHLDPATLDKVRTLSKEINALTENFEQTVAKDKRHMTADQAQLTGLDEAFINSLKKTEDGKVILGVDYPTVHQILTYCTHPTIRKELYLLFNNRGMPSNKETLEKLLQLRAQKAKLLGFANFAELDIAGQMAKSPQVVAQFLADLFKKAQVKEEKEFNILKDNLPAGVTLNPDGTLNPWDKPFAIEYYRKTALDLDENLIKEYFPLEKSLEGLFAIYQKFFDVTFTQEAATGLWDDQLIFVQVFSKDKELLGSIILDLFPREGKYTHACQTSFIPAMFDKNGKRIPAVVLVIANFPKPTSEQPSLLNHREVETFFHEFGHALHTIFGATKLFGQAGTAVKSDFVEMPSQMLEEWLWDKQMLKDVSSHYKTKQPLPDDLIERMIEAKNVFAGTQTDRQIMLATYSLELHRAPQPVNSDVLLEKLSKQYRPYDAYIPETHFQAAFGHLASGLYASKYYGYLWSEVYAADLFETIKKQGLTNPAIGTKYRDMILAKGGSADPEELIVAFLGRKPTQDAFLRNLGLK